MRKHYSNLQLEVLHAAVVVRSLDQNVTWSRFGGLLVQPVLHLSRTEVVLKHSERFCTEYKFFNLHVRPRKVEPTQRPLCVTGKKILWVFVCLLDELSFSAHEHLEMRQKKLLLGVWFFCLLLKHILTPLGYLSLIGVKDLLVRNGSVEVNVRLF